MVKILFLAANPLDTDRLRLDEEVRAIDTALRQAEFREQFVLLSHWAVRINDLQELLLRHQPDIVHFSGHGSTASEIILHNEQGKAVTVPAEALSHLFKVLKDNIRCVVLSACYSDDQATSIAQHIDCVVGHCSLCPVRDGCLCLHGYDASQVKKRVSNLPGRFSCRLVRHGG